jgi:apolipoprotein N-acyltransferase
VGSGRRLLLAFPAGAAAALGQAPFGLWPVSLAGFAVLAWLVAGAVGVSRSGALPRTPAYFSQEEKDVADRAGRVAWAGGAGYFAVALHWIVQPFMVDAATHGWMAPFALVLMAAGLALFWGVAGWLSVRLGCNRAISWALCLAAAEMLRGHVLTGFPWALPAYIWADTDVRLLAAVLGPYGLTLLTLALTSLAVMDGAVLRARAPLMAGAVFLAMMLGAGLRSGEVQLTDKMVRLVQPNAPQDEKWDPEKAHLFVRRALDFTASPGDGVDLIVWPETAIPYPLDLAGPVFSRIAEISGGVPVFTGLNRRNDADEWFNSSALVDGDGRVVETYDKVHLVPFGEYIPLRIDLIRALAATTGYGFVPGDGVRMIDTPLGRTVPLICYEAIFPRHSAGLEERQDYLLQITNDAWFGTFSGPYQHLDQARFRAVEQGLPLIRAANTGVSAVIDPHGRVRESLALGEAGYIDALLPEGLPPTPYSRTGDLPLAIMLLVMMIGLFVAGRRNGIANRSASS